MVSTFNNKFRGSKKWGLDTVQLKDSYINASGGALHVQGGTVSSAAAISNCYARNGGGVTASGGTFTMTGGSMRCTPYNRVNKYVAEV
jgi:hypothetical protein